MGQIFAIAAALSLVGVPHGTLIGHVNIGPITPVERVGQKQTPPPSWYKPYVVLVYRGDKMKVSFAAKRVKINGRGDFSTHLVPGLYWVQVSRDDNAPNWRPLPRRQVPIRANQISRVTFDIDTGIR